MSCLLDLLDFRGAIGLPRPRSSAFRRYHVAHALLAPEERQSDHVGAKTDNITGQAKIDRHLETVARRLNSEEMRNDVVILEDRHDSPLANNVSAISRVPEHNPLQARCLAGVLETLVAERCRFQVSHAEDMR